MQMYPAYNLHDVMAERAIVFFTLLNEGYKIRFQHYHMLAIITMSPNMKESGQKQLLQQLEFLSNDSDDILDSSEDSNSIADLKRIL